MHLTRREFLGRTAAACLAAPAWAQSEESSPPPPRIIYYNNFASHLLCAFNPNMYYPKLPYRWADGDWRRLVDMIASFGFNVFEFWLEPRLFSREALDSPVGKEFTRQLNVVIEHAHARGLQVEMIVAIATVGETWRTLCPNLPDEWREIRFLWDAWIRRFPGLDIAGIFPGDPGACSRNGCTAETYIDRSIEVAALLDQVRPGIGIDFNTWGPPFFGWGNIRMAPNSQGEFIPEDQGTAWTFSKERADRSMNHLLKRLGDFPTNTVVSINLGFNGDGNPRGEQDARLFADLTAPHPDYDALKQVYWNRVYKIYDTLPNHVDPRPRGNTERFVRHFVDWT